MLYENNIIYIYIMHLKLKTYISGNKICLNFYGIKKNQGILRHFKYIYIFILGVYSTYHANGYLYLKTHHLYIVTAANVHTYRKFEKSLTYQIMCYRVIMFHNIIYCYITTYIFLYENNTHNFLGLVTQL